ELIAVLGPLPHSLGPNGFELDKIRGGVLGKQINQLDNEIELALDGIRFVLPHDLAAAQEVGLVEQVEAAGLLAAADDGGVDDDLLARTQGELERHGPRASTRLVRYPART